MSLLPRCGCPSLQRELGHRAGNHPLQRLVQAGLIAHQDGFTDLLALGSLGPMPFKRFGQVSDGAVLGRLEQEMAKRRDEHGLDDVRVQPGLGWNVTSVSPAGS